MALIRWRVAVVATRCGDHVSEIEVEWRRDLLASRQTCDRRAPDHMPIAHGELPDESIGCGRVDGLPVGVGDWRRGRYAVRPGERVVVRWRESPENGAIGRIDRQGLSVGRRREERIVRG